MNPLVFKNLTLFLLLTLSFSLLSQSKIDSLKRELNYSSNDTTTLSIYGLIGDDFYYKGENDSAIFYWELAKEFALTSQKKEFSEIYKFVINKKLSVFFNDLAYLNVEKGNFNTAIEYFHECILLKQSINDSRGETNTYTNLGYLYIKKRDLDSALFYNLAAHKLAKTNNFEEIEAASAVQLGLIFTEIGEINQALAYLNKSVIYFSSNNDTLELAKSYNNIAKSYQKLNDYNTALEFYFKSLELKIKLGNKKSSATAYNNIGACYFKIDELELAVKYNKKALDLFIEIQDKIGEATTLNNIGFMHYQMNEMEEALSIYTKSLAIRESISDIEGIAFSLLNISKIHSFDANYNEALFLLQKVYKLALETKNIELLSDCSLQLSLNYEKIKDNQRALSHYKKHIYYQNKLNNNSNIDKARHINAIIKIQQQNYKDSISLVIQSRNEVKSLEQEIRESSFIVSKKYTYIFLFGLALLIGLLIYKKILP